MNVHEAKTNLSRLLESVEAGEDVVIARAGKPVARLVPAVTRGVRRPGVWRGQIVIDDDFDAPDPEVERAFLGEDDASAPDR